MKQVWLMNRDCKVAAAATPAPAAEPPAQIGAPGLLRQATQDGRGAVSTLPNGVRIVDGPETYALDPSGKRMPVQRTQLPSESGQRHLLSVITPDGVGYTIASDNMDLIIQSADGKVHQLVGPTGKILTSIADNGNHHLIEMSPTSGVVGSPGTRIDPRFPDRVFVDGSPAGSYPVPHPFARPMPSAGAPGAMPGTPGAATAAPAATSGATAAAPVAAGVPSGTGAAEPATPTPEGVMAGPGGVQPGFRPSFWDRLKGAFTGENPWNPTTMDASRTHGYPASSPYPGSYQQFDPVAAQFQQMQRSNEMMMWTTMGMGMVNQMSMMSMMFYPSPWGFF